MGAISQLKHMIGKSQHSFTRGKPCLTNLIAFSNEITCSVDVGRAVDIIYLDFSKALDTVSPQPPNKETDVSQSAQVVYAVVGIWLTATPRGWW